MLGPLCSVPILATRGLVHCVNFPALTVCFPAAGTETLAKAQGDGTYKLYGYKWFTSATDSEMALTLARVVDEYGQTTEVGTRNSQ